MENMKKEELKMKYNVKRTDGRDNSNEKYVVIRVDSNAKDVYINRRAVKELCKILETSTEESSIIASKEIKELLLKLELEDEINKSNILNSYT